jgi:hypothetical protein
MTGACTILIDPKVAEAAQWIANGDPRPDIVPEIRRRFELSALQAAQACGLAQKLRTSRKAIQ